MKHLKNIIKKYAPDAVIEVDGSIFVDEGANISVEILKKIVKEFSENVRNEQKHICAIWDISQIHSDNQCSPPLARKIYNGFQNALDVQIELYL